MASNWHVRLIDKATGKTLWVDGGHETEADAKHAGQVAMVAYLATHRVNMDYDENFPVWIETEAV